VPRHFRCEWRREWEAEIVSHWLLLQQWGRLNGGSKFYLLVRLEGAFLDVLWFQKRRTSLLLVTLNMLVALLTGFGAAQQLCVRGLGDQQLQPLLLGLVGMVVSILFATSGIGLWREWFNVRRLIAVTGTLSILFHVYGALPPHRIIGLVALIVGGGYGLLMLLVCKGNGKRKVFL
jgi:hypothetical protein